jgi:hypothetical protein
MINEPTKTAYQLMHQSYVDEAERAALKRLPATTSLCRLSTFLRIAMVGGFGWQMREAFVRWLVSEKDGQLSLLLSGTEMFLLAYLKAQAKGSQEMVTVA